jgi:hypothetical protein
MQGQYKHEFNDHIGLLISRYRFRLFQRRNAIQIYPGFIGRNNRLSVVLTDSDFLPNRLLRPICPSTSLFVVRQ